MATNEDAIGTAITLLLDIANILAGMPPAVAAKVTTAQRWDLRTAIDGASEALAKVDAAAKRQKC